MQPNLKNRAEETKKKMVFHINHFISFEINVHCWFDVDAVLTACVSNTSKEYHTRSYSLTLLFYAIKWSATLSHSTYTQTMSGSTSNFNEFKRQVDSCHFELLLFAQNSQNIVHLSKNKHPSYFHMVYTIRNGIHYIGCSTSTFLQIYHQMRSDFISIAYQINVWHLTEQPIYSFKQTCYADKKNLNAFP